MSEPLNIFIGLKLKKKRNELNLSQIKVANAIKVTFQHIQKYEKGINVLSASRIFDLSNYLNVPISYFFEGYEGFQPKFDTSNHRINWEFIHKLFASLNDDYQQKLLSNILEIDTIFKQNKEVMNS